MRCSGHRRLIAGQWLAGPLILRELPGRRLWRSSTFIMHRITSQLLLLEISILTMQLRLLNGILVV